MIYNQNGSPFLKIVYTKVKINGKVELVPMELYADGLLKHGNYRNPVWGSELSRLGAV